MADALTQLLTYTQAWEPPVYPALDDPTWQDAFATANTQQRNNLATCWLWQFNQHCKDQNITDWFISLNEHVDWIRTLHPYTNPDLLDGEFDGTVDSVLRLVKMGPAIGGTLHHALTALWFGPEDTHAAAIVDMMTYLSDNAVGDHTLYGLCHNLVWRNVSDEVRDTPTLSAAVQLSVLCSKYSVATLADSKLDSAWGKLASTAFYRSSINNSAIKKAIRKTPDTIALTHFPSVLNLSLPSNTTGFSLSATLHQGNPFVPETAASVHQVLNTWFPEYTSHWDTSAALGVPYPEACARVVAALRAEATVQPTPPELPSTLVAPP